MNWYSFRKLWFVFFLLIDVFTSTTTTTTSTATTTTNNNTNNIVTINIHLYPLCCRSFHVFTTTGGFGAAPLFR